MTKKLTGRQAVITLMQGNKVRKTGAPSYFYLSEQNRLCRRIPSGEHEECEFGIEHCFFRHDDWEIVQEPEVWEGELEGRLGGLVTIGSEYMPNWMQNKLVKVRIEEILE